MTWILREQWVANWTVLFNDLCSERQCISIWQIRKYQNLGNKVNGLFLKKGLNFKKQLNSLLLDLDWGRLENGILHKYIFLRTYRQVKISQNLTVAENRCIKLKYYFILFGFSFAISRTQTSKKQTNDTPKQKLQTLHFTTCNTKNNKKYIR